MNGHSSHASKSPSFQPENAAGAWPTSSTPRDSPAIELVNGFFDRVVRPTVSPGNRKWNSYRLWQCVGLAVGAAAILTFTAVKGLSLPVVAALILVSILVAVLLYTSTDRLGAPRPLLIWARKGVYHYQMVCIAGAALLLRVMQEPALSYLDVLVVGFALAQVLGRIGCLMVGCCHGRPGRWGVRYGERHSAAGYTHYLLGARLFPIPLIEAIWLLLLSLFGTARIVGSAYRPGEVLAWYVVAYGAVRFFLEFARADTDRLFWGGFSEAQWTAIAAMGVVVALERAAVLPARQWHAGAAAGLVAVMVAVALERRFSTASGHLLLHPYHLREVAGVVNWLLELADSQSETSDRGTIRAPVFSADTSLGFRISLSIRDGQPGGAYEYALACSGQRPKTHAMAALAKFIVRYRHAGCSYQTTRGDDGEVNLRISSGCGARTC